MQSGVDDGSGTVLVDWPAWYLRRCPARLEVVLALQPLQFLHQSLLDLLVGHVFDSLDHDVRQRLLILQLMARLVVPAGVLTDTGPRRSLRARCSSVAARPGPLPLHRSLRLLVPARRTVAVRVIVIVDVDIVIVDYLNDLARRALAQLPQLQLAEPESIQLLLQLVTGLATQAIPCAAGRLRRRPHEHLRVRLPRRVLGSSTDLCRLVGRLPLLSGAALALKLLDRRLR